MFGIMVLESEVQVLGLLLSGVDACRCMASWAGQATEATVARLFTGAAQRRSAHKAGRAGRGRGGGA